MRFEALLDRQERGELSQIEAAEMLGVSERTFRRWRDRLRDEGPAGLADRRIGKPSGRRAAADEILRMLGLYREHYAEFTVKHFHEQLVKRHDWRLGYTVTKLQLHRAGLVKCIGLDMIGQLSDLGVRLRASDRSDQQATAMGWLC